MRPICALACLTLACLFVMGGCAQLNPFKRTDNVAARGLPVGVPAPELNAEDFAGSRVRLSDHRGKVVAVIFWRTDCPPCRAMFPHERELVERHRGKPFVLIGVNCDSNHEAARAMIAAERLTWPICKTTGPDDPIYQQWKVPHLPTIYVIDAKGIIRYAQVRGPALESAIDTLLAQTP